MKTLKKLWSILKRGSANAPPPHDISPLTLLEASKDLRKIGLGGLTGGLAGIFAAGGSLISSGLAALLLLVGAAVWIAGIALDALARHAQK